MGILNLIPNRSISSTSAWTYKGLTNYSHRDSTRIFEHKGLLYLSNGYQPGGVLVRDLWKSFDGIDWFPVNLNTPYLGWCPVVSFKGSIVALGNSIMKSDDDGVTFSTVLASAPFDMPQNTRGTWWALVRGETLILIGKNKTWWTSDLISWASRDMPFYRENFAVWDMGGRVFLAAGSSEGAKTPPETGYPNLTSFNDVWANSDPITNSWSRLVESAPWVPRMWPAFAVHGGELVITGGYDNVSGATNFNDTWASRDGVSWRQIASAVRYSPRHYSQLVSRSGQLILNNGNRNPNTPPGTINDVWTLE